MYSFEALILGSLEKLSPLTVENDSFDLALKLSEDLDSFCVMLNQLEKRFKYLTVKVFLQFPRTFNIQLQIIIINNFLSVDFNEQNI